MNLIKIEHSSNSVQFLGITGDGISEIDPILTSSF